jgi:hypothetical protein
MIPNNNSICTVLPKSNGELTHNPARDQTITSFFSTRVINGAESKPDLNKILERKHIGRMYIFSNE